MSAIAGIRNERVKSFSPIYIQVPAHRNWLLPLSEDCSKALMYHTKVIYQHNDVFHFEVHGLVCNLIEQS